MVGETVAKLFFPSNVHLQMSGDGFREAGGRENECNMGWGL